MTDNKKHEIPSTREMVETVIDLTKLDRSASWDRLAHGDRQPKCWQDGEAYQPKQTRRRGKRAVTDASAS